jgi:MFS family permease
VVSITYLFWAAIQGIGGGGVINLSEIIMSDLVTLEERGLYQGILGMTWSFASGIGPPIVRDSSLS